MRATWPGAWVDVVKNLQLCSNKTIDGRCLHKNKPFISSISCQWYVAIFESKLYFCNIVFKYTIWKQYFDINSGLIMSRAICWDRRSIMNGTVFDYSNNTTIISFHFILAHHGHQCITQVVKSVLHITIFTSQQSGDRCSCSMSTEAFTDQHATQFAAQPLGEPVSWDIQFAALNNTVLYCQLQLSRAVR